MTIKSMTGFARADGAAGPMSWTWEVRSVNGRGIDLRLRLAPGFEGLEPQVREGVMQRISRGSLTINLNVKRVEGASQIRLNEVALSQVLTALGRLRAIVDVAPPRPEALLAVRGVLEIAEPEESEEEGKVRTAAMLGSLGAVLDAMVAARASEGSRLKAIVCQQLAAIERLVAVIAASPARSSEAIRQRLKEQLARIFDTGVALDEARLYQEAAMLATKADVEEELNRLAAHICAARELLNSDEPAGRRLDFLAQEFNREANTVCSKANDGETTRAGLELKAVIDQMREQVQNIE
jgi:uncharacterized protein (TIGR00255 family)